MIQNTINRNTLYFSIANALFSFSNGFFMPFQFALIGRISTISIAVFIGIFVLAQSVSSFLFGKYCDRFGVKNYTITAFLGLSLFFFVFNFIQSVQALIFTHVLYGIFMSMIILGEKVMITKLFNQAQGKRVGYYQSIVISFSGIAMILGSFLQNWLWLYFLSFLMLISASCVKNIKSDTI